MFAGYGARLGQLECFTAIGLLPFRGGADSHLNFLSNKLSVAVREILLTKGRSGMWNPCKEYFIVKFLNIFQQTS